MKLVSQRMSGFQVQNWKFNIFKKRMSGYYKYSSLLDWINFTLSIKGIFLLNIKNFLTINWRNTDIPVEDTKKQEFNSPKKEMIKIADQIFKQLVYKFLENKWWPVEAGMDLARINPIRLILLHGWLNKKNAVDLTYFDFSKAFDNFFLILLRKCC